MRKIVLVAGAECKIMPEKVNFSIEIDARDWIAHGHHLALLAHPIARTHILRTDDRNPGTKQRA